MRIVMNVSMIFILIKPPAYIYRIYRIVYCNTPYKMGCNEIVIAAFELLSIVVAVVCAQINTHIIDSFACNICVMHYNLCVYVFIQYVNFLKRSHIPQ
jgi:hypothetical protein